MTPSSTYVFLALHLLTSLVPPAQATYTLQDDYNPSNFFNMVDFYTGADPTNGYVNYLDETDAQVLGLVTTQNNQIYMGVDHGSIAQSPGRGSVRVSSTASYNHGLIILDLAHMPGGICGTWPAFWLTGPNWPDDGEVDIIENVNSAATNRMTLHTDAGCTITNNGLSSGTILGSNCDVAATDNAGCSIGTSNTQTFGAGFNAIGGGVYATEWTSSAFSIWFFPRGSIPSDITNGTPDPSGWGLALAEFSGGCDIDEHFIDQQLVFDTTFCGDWAGAVWSTDAVCSTKAATCQDYVQNNPTDFVDAYWAINSLKVYQDNGAAVSSSPSSAAASRTRLTTTSTSLAVTTTSSTITTAGISSSTVVTSTTSLISATTTSFTFSNTFFTPPTTTSSPTTSSSFSNTFTPLTATSSTLTSISFSNQFFTASTTKSLSTTNFGFANPFFTPPTTTPSTTENPTTTSFPSINSFFTPPTSPYPMTTGFPSPNGFFPV